MSDVQDLLGVLPDIRFGCGGYARSVDQLKASITALQQQIANGKLNGAALHALQRTERELGRELAWLQREIG